MADWDKILPQYPGVDLKWSTDQYYNPATGEKQIGTSMNRETLNQLWDVGADPAYIARPWSQKDWKSSTSNQKPKPTDKNQSSDAAKKNTTQNK